MYLKPGRSHQFSKKSPEAHWVATTSHHFHRRMGESWEKYSINGLTNKVNRRTSMTTQLLPEVMLEVAQNQSDWYSGPQLQPVRQILSVHQPEFSRLKKKRTGCFRYGQWGHYFRECHLTRFDIRHRIENLYFRDMWHNKVTILTHMYRLITQPNRLICHLLHN